MVRVNSPCTVCGRNDEAVCQFQKKLVDGQGVLVVWGNFVCFPINVREVEVACKPKKGFSKFVSDGDFIAKLFTFIEREVTGSKGTAKDNGGFSRDSNFNKNGFRYFAFMDQGTI